MDVQIFCNDIASPRILKFLNSMTTMEQQNFVDAYECIIDLFPSCDVYPSRQQHPTYYHVYFGVNPYLEYGSGKGSPRITLTKFRTGVCVWEGGADKKSNNVFNFDGDKEGLNEWIENLNISHQNMKGTNLKIKNYQDSFMTKDDQVISDDIQLPLSPLNQILYGPPGTGKTYQTIEAAVKAAEPTLYAELGIDEAEGTTIEQRTQLTEIYKELTDAGRVRFVTFHQSYGYEEFVEGLKAKTDDDGNIKYEVEDGIFKALCDDAKDDKYSQLLAANSKPKVWKLSIEWAGKSKVCDDCFEKNIARIGWGEAGDRSQPEALSDESKEYFELLGRNEKSSVTEFSQNASVGDLVLVLSSIKTIKAVGIVSGEYNYEPEGHPLLNSYRHVLPVNWLVKNVELPIVDINGGVSLTQKTFYHLWRIKPHDVFSLIEKHNLAAAEIKTQKNQNYVLIIDEINRGNISKIFGELITLIEPSKRSGLDSFGNENLEALSVNLPHTPNKPFSVPDNVYLIGTMNTADRSLAMMDTALRRRFDFVEMMPDYRVLNYEDGMPYCIDIDGIKVNIPKLLSTMNERIEVLYDREHTLGHAFFMPVLDALNSGKKNSDVKAFSELQRIFKNKIIPLLEEYFFEDWNKIRLVLGDNQKTTTSSEVNKKLEKMMFVQATMKKYSSFFGDNHGLDAYENEKTIYKLASFTDENSPWKNKALYQAIYDEEKLKAIIKNTENSVKTQKEAEQNKQQEAQSAKESASESEVVI